MSVLCSGFIFLSVMYTAAISASAAEAITVLVLCAIFNTGTLSFGFGSFSEIKIWASALLRALDLLRKHASACTDNIVSLFRKRYHRQCLLHCSQRVVRSRPLFHRLQLLDGLLFYSMLLGVFC